MQAADENQVRAGCTGPIAERHGEAAMVELETLDILQTLIYHTDATRLPEPNELARLLGRLRSKGVMSLEYGWLTQLTEAVEQASHCWQHGFVAGEVAYADAHELPTWPSTTDITAWAERDSRSYSPEHFQRRWYTAGWLAGWGDH
jgi:hypothetical protein